MAETRRRSIKWTGLGLWNVFFISEFLLSSFSYLSLNFQYNIILIAFVLFPVGNRYLHWLRNFIAIIAAVALVYNESWLPGIDSIRGNFHNLVAMDTSYLLESVYNFINWQMVGIVLALIIFYYALRDYIRVTTFTIAYFLILFCAPLWQPWFEQTPQVQTAQVVEPVHQAAEQQPAQKSSDLIPQNEPANSKNLSEWLRAFYFSEKERRAVWPEQLGKEDTPFDILLLNICSLSNDDMAAAGLDKHQVLSKFDIAFDNFNSATSYSGPAALRLLKSACGQPSHDDLYEARNPDCEIMNRLARLGYNQYVFMDHSGQYDNFYQSLRHLAGLSPQLKPMTYPKAYDSFDEEPIGNTKAVFQDWEKSLQANKDQRTVTFINLIALHDGNRFAGKRRLAAFKPRAQTMLDDLDALISDVQKTGRKVMLMVVPEHGAAERGDKVQVAHLRDIPSPAITKVPVLIKFIGLTPKGAPVQVKEPTSYLALSTLIGRVLQTNYFAKPEGEIPLTDLVKDLPQTYPVSENANAVVLKYQDKVFVKMDKGDWREYAK